MSALTAEHRSIKDDLLAVLRDLAKLADDTGMHSLVNELLVQRIPKLDEERFVLVVLGEFNHGKSTFVNALLGSSVLPAGITPTTAAVIAASAPDSAMTLPAMVSMIRALVVVVIEMYLP